MLKRTLTYIFIIALLPLLWSPPGLASEPSARDIAERVYHRDIGEDMRLQGIMTLISPSGHQRVREYYTLRRDVGDMRKLLIRFTAPADIAGTAFLVLENTATDETEQHLYLPALKRTRRIVASQQGRSFVNSDFTYEDMQRQPLDDWSYRLEGHETIHGRICYKLISTPKETSDSQYTQVVSWIDREYNLPLQNYYFDNKQRHSKTYRVEQLQLIDGIATETLIVMEDLLDEHVTRLEISEVHYNTGIEDHRFTTRALEDW